MSAEERKKEAAWFDVGIIKGTSCTVSSYYLPNGELEKTEIDVEVSNFSIGRYLLVPYLSTCFWC